MKVSIYWPAVIAAAVAKFVLGALWYSPPLFASQWAAAVGINMNTQMDGGEMAKIFGGSFIAYIVQAYVMVHFVQYAGAKDSKGGAQSGFWLWLGFAAVVVFQTVLYERRPFNLFFINSGYELITLLAMGVILATWKKKQTAA
jgi:hypothetical protein